MCISIFQFLINGGSYKLFRFFGNNSLSSDCSRWLWRRFAILLLSTPEDDWLCHCVVRRIIFDWDIYEILYFFHISYVLFIYPPRESFRVSHLIHLIHRSSFKNQFHMNHQHHVRGWQDDSKVVEIRDNLGWS